MVSRTAAANATAVALGASTFCLTCIKVRRFVGSSELYLQIFNNNAPTVGITVPNMVLPIPALQSGMQAMIQRYPMSGNRGGFRLGTGLAYAVTTTPTGSTNPTSGEEPEVELYYEPGN